MGLIAACGPGSGRAEAPAAGGPRPEITRSSKWGGPPRPGFHAGLATVSTQCRPALTGAGPLAPYSLVSWGELAKRRGGRARAGDSVPGGRACGSRSGPENAVTGLWRARDVTLARTCGAR